MTTDTARRDGVARADGNGRPRLLVVEPDPLAGPDRFADWLAAAGLALRVVRPHAGEPLPAGLDEDAAVRRLDPEKDVDGFPPENAARLYLGEPLFVPATPLGVMRLLEEYQVPLEGARAVVVGRSLIVGKPMAMLLLAANATVTIAHSRTRDLAEHTREADVLVVAVGRPNVVTAAMVKPGAAVVDVGMNRTEEGLRGDVDPGAAEVAGLITPVPGGVGPMTIASLLGNTISAARRRRC